MDAPGTLTGDIQAAVRRQRTASPDEWDGLLAKAIEPHLIGVAQRAAEAVAYGASVEPMIPYLKAMAANAASAWNDVTRAAAAGSQKADGDAFDQAAELRAPILAQSLTTEANGFATVDTAKAVGKTTKTWTGASGKRASHARVNGETVPVEAPFSNGQQWPGGPNCKCSVTVDSPDPGHVVDPLTRKDLAIPPDSLSRTRAVTDGEYQKLAAEGRTLLERWRRNKSAPTALDEGWDDVKERSWVSVQKEWGGTTIDAHTGAAVEQGQRRFAITAKAPGQDTVAVPIGSTRAEFDAAMSEARRRFDGQLQDEKAHLGVFRNEETASLEMDPVIVVDSLAEVERIGAYTKARGGAYSFEDGLGYWPPYVK